MAISGQRPDQGDAQQMLRQLAHEPCPIRHADAGRHDDKIDRAHYQTIRLNLGVAQLA
jgi:hypothetical protein